MLKTIDPGEFRTPIVLQTPSITRDTVGQAQKTWTDVVTIWARVSPISAREQFYAQQNQATTTHSIACRYDSRIVPTARFKMGGRIFNVDGVRNLDERNVYLLIQATEQIPSEA
jgi:SPP1 family predicted phage head-tail adaptor